MLSKPYAWREGDEEARGVLDPVVVLLAAEGMSSSRRRGSISSGSISSPRPRKARPEGNGIGKSWTASAPSTHPLATGW